MIEIVVEGDIVGKERPRGARRGGGIAFYTPKKTADYEDVIRWAAKAAMRGKERLDTAAVHLDTLMVFRIPRSWPLHAKAKALVGIIRPTVKPDFDNVLKTVDALKGIVWADDARVCAGSFDKIYGAQPRLVLRVSPIEGTIPWPPRRQSAPAAALP